MQTSIAAGSVGLAAPALAHVKGETYVLPEEYMPREVRLRDKFPAGEIHVDPNQFALYWTLERKKAIRYTVGIGRGNLYHSGVFHVGAKQEWPRWIPTDDMKERSPEAYADFAEGEIYENGMPGGIANPLGARALYLYTAAGKDTYLRIHGTNNPKTIGVAVSNGCARLVNDQVKELYEMVPVGTKVVLLEKIGAPPAHSQIS
ncbi:MAG: L,D-transpeptidase [Paracoccaceae bacterium]